VFLGSAVFIIGAPFAFGVTVGWFGWLILFGAAVFVFAAAMAWYFLHDWMTPLPDYVAPPKAPPEAQSGDLSIATQPAEEAGGHAQEAAPPTAAPS
jgi:hypothetical protein